jgi:hypothetical protein
MGKGFVREAGHRRTRTARSRRGHGGHFGSDNDNHFNLFSAGGMDFIVISLEYDTTPDQPVLDWADSLLKAHPNRCSSTSIRDTSGCWRSRAPGGRRAPS